MKTFYYFLYIFFISLYKNKVVNARSIYDDPHLGEREENVQVLSPYSKKKLLKDEIVRENSGVSDNEVAEASNSVYDAPRFRQYDSAEMYVPQSPRIMGRSNIDNTFYDVKKREYYPDMKTGRDASLEVVLDPKARKAVALIDDTAGQRTYDLSGWKNTNNDLYGYDNEPYSQGNQDQVVNLIYPVRRSDRISNSNTLDATGVLDTGQSLNQNKNQKNMQDYDTQGQYLYKATINEPDRESGAQKIKRHIKNIDDMKYNKNDVNNLRERNAEQNVGNVYDTENSDKYRIKDGKRNIASWTNEQITALKDSIAMLQENNMEYENLRNILGDMGLIEIPAIKRDTNNVQDEAEDENLSKNDVVMKKNNKKWQQTVEDLPQESIDKREINADEKQDKTSYKKNLESNSEEHKNEVNKIDNEAERKKRNSDVTANSPDIMKGLEKSGELSVSGNKSPLASDEKSEADTTGNEKISETAVEKENMGKRNIDNQDEDYEQRIESEIQAKIDTIKEKVKREIMMQKQKQKYQKVRNKREATLLDSENKDINPNFLSNEAFQPHVRTRRKVNEETKVFKNNKETDAANKRQIIAQNITEFSTEQTQAHNRVKRDIMNEKILPEKRIFKREIDKSNLQYDKSDKDIEKTQSENDNEEMSESRKIKSPVEDSIITLNVPSTQQKIRSKRANSLLPENKMIYRPYLSPQDEEEIEGGEFDKAYDQMYVEKREAYEPDYQYFENKDEDLNKEYQSPEKDLNLENLSRNQRHCRSHGNNAASVKSDKQHISRNAQVKHNSDKIIREKRNNENVKLHGGNILSSRKSLKNKAISTNHGKSGNPHNIESEQDDSDNSENDFFGALPQNYEEGELNRYKRVKRNNDNKNELTDIT